MAREVNTVLAKIIAEQRGIPDSKAEEIVKSMRSANQYQVRDLAPVHLPRPYWLSGGTRVPGTDAEEECDECLREVNKQTTTDTLFSPFRKMYGHENRLQTLTQWIPMRLIAMELVGPPVVRLYCTCSSYCALHACHPIYSDVCFLPQSGGVRCHQLNDMLVFKLASSLACMPNALARS